MSQHFAVPALTDREAALSVYSDTYKDAYNVRPRFSLDHLSTEEIWVEADGLASDVAANIEREREWERAAALEAVERAEAIEDAAHAALEARASRKGNARAAKRG